MKILVTGAGGGMGQEIPHVFTEDELTLLPRTHCDVTDSPAVESAVQAAQPDLIIHTAAYTAVDAAEDDETNAQRINVEGTANVARAAKRAGAALVYPSTDYVFDGMGSRPYTEDDPANPLSVYGLTKLEGERVAVAEQPDTFVVRSQVYWQQGKSFVSIMQKLLREQPEVRAIVDQVISLTYGRDFLRAVQRLVATRQYGTYHVVVSDFVSRLEFVEAIAKHEKSLAEIKPIRDADWESAAERPLFAGLDGSKLAKLGITLPDWKQSLRHFFSDQAKESA